MGLLAGSSAQAQNRLPEFDVQNVRPSIDSRRTLLTDDAGLAPSNSFMGRLVFSQAADLRRLRRTGSTASLRYSKNLMTGHLMGAYTISRFRVGLDVPMVLSATSDVLESQGGLRDMAVDMRGTILDPTDAPVGLAVSTRFGLPTATVDLPIGGSGIGYEGCRYRRQAHGWSLGRGKPGLQGPSAR